MTPSQLLQFPFTTGVDEGVDPRLAKPGTLKSLKNYVWNKDGLLEKRFGTTAVVQDILPSGTISSAKRLAGYRDMLCLVTGQHLYTYSDRGGWIDGGSVPEVGLTWPTSTAVNPSGVQSCDLGRTSDGLLVLACVKGDPTSADIAVSEVGELTIQISEPNGQTQVMTVASNVSFCRVLTFGTDWIVVYSNDANELNQVDAAGTITLLANDGFDGTWSYIPFDACMTEDASGDFLLAYEDTGTDLVLNRFSFAGAAVAGPVVVDSASDYSAIGLCSTAEGDVYVVFGKTGNSWYAVHNETTLAQTAAATSLISSAGFVVSHVGACRYASGEAIVMVSGRTTAAPFRSGTTQTFGGTNVGGFTPARATAYTRALSRPFSFNGKFYIFLSDYSQTTELTDDLAGGRTGVFPGNNSYLAEIVNDGQVDNHVYAGLIDIQVAGCETQGSLSAVVTKSSTEMIAPLPYTFQGAQIAYIWAQGVRFVSVTAGSSAPVDLWHGTGLGPEFYFSGAVFTAWDGRHTFDFGFPRTTPIGINSSGPSAGGGTMIAGDYRYQLVPVFASSAGIKHRGPASPVVKYTPVLNGKVTLVWLDKALASKVTTDIDNVIRSYVEIYRTEVNLEVEHKLTMEPLYAVTTTNTFVDTKIDSNIAGPVAVKLGSRPGIYTTAELDDYAPPASITSVVHKDRLFVIAGDTRTVWFSKNFNEDQTVAPGFHPNAIMVFEESLTALASLADMLIVFSLDNIWYVRGDGPAVNGDNSDYFPIKLQADIGCVNARSVVSTPAGVFFESARGLYLLEAGLSLKWLGESVQDTLTSYPVITSAVLVPQLNHVRFSCNALDGLSGVVLNFDIARGEWSVFEYADGATARTPIADATMYNDAYHFVTPGGLVYRESEGVYLDGASWIFGELETAEIYSDGPLAYHRTRRAYLLGDRMSTCDTSMSVAIDALSSYDQVRQWTSAELATIGSGDIGVHIRRQKSKSVRIRWQDAPPSSGGTGTGQGLRFSAIGFEIASKQGLDKRPAAQRK